MSINLVWIAVGLLLVLLEFAIPGFIIFFFGVGAILVGALLYLFDMSVPGQIMLFVGFSVALIFIARRIFPKVFYGASDHKHPDIDGEFDCAGEHAVVVEPIIGGLPGKVYFHGSLWNAESELELAVGNNVCIIKRQNITLIVK